MSHNCPAKRVARAKITSLQQEHRENGNCPFPTALWSGARTASRQKTNDHILASAQLVPWPQQGSEPLQASVTGWSLTGFVPSVLLFDSKRLTMSFCLPRILFPRESPLQSYGPPATLITVVLVHTGPRPANHNNQSSTPISDWSILTWGLSITVPISIPIDDWGTGCKPANHSNHPSTPTSDWSTGLTITVTTPPSLLITGSITHTDPLITVTTLSPTSVIGPKGCTTNFLP